MFETVTQDFDIKRGETWLPTFNINMDLTGWLVTVVVGTDRIVLSDGDGLAIAYNTPVAGQTQVVAKVSRLITQGWQSNQHWYMELINSEGDGGFPMNGTIKVKSP